jgi:hypothetical protein
MTDTANYHAKSQANIARAGHSDIDPALLSGFEAYIPFTMTTMERMFALHQAVDHVVRNKIAGTIVETGVWRGGSMMLVAQALQRLGELRDLWCYDTFEGQPEPDDARDRDIWGNSNLEAWRRHVVDGKYVGSQAGLDEVLRNILGTGWPLDHLHCVKGLVEETIPAQVPDTIALLRIDTDWYASVKHGLEHLYPRLVSGGVLIIDDYGHQIGAREATDEYLASLERSPLLVRVDYSCRLAVKP